VSRRILLVTTGSLGDLHPCLALARELERRGHATCVASMAEHEPHVRAAGLAFRAVRPSLGELLEDHGLTLEELAQQVMADPLMMFRDLVFPYVRRAYQDLLAEVAESSLVLTSSLAFAARLAADRLQVPRMAIVLQPMMFLSAHDPPQTQLAPWMGPVLRALGPAVTAAVLRLVRLGMSREAKPLHALARELGLPSDPDPVFQGQFSRHGTLALYSPRLGALQADYPPRTAITGFTFFDGAEAPEPAPSSALAQFIESGPAPLVFTLGSFATESAGDFYAVAAEVARRLRLRAVLVVGASALARAQALATGDVRVSEYLPYSWIFPRARAVIHQGGIGTFAQALRAGRPQLIVPFLADQPDTAWRAGRLGVATSLSRAHFSVTRGCEAVARLLEQESVAARAAAIGREVAAERGAEAAARHIEQSLGQL
jgi:rhamnosyltransferase subunit B